MNPKKNLRLGFLTKTRCFRFKPTPSRAVLGAARDKFGLSSDVKRNARCRSGIGLVDQDLRGCSMPAYSHLLDEERDQIAVMTAAGRSVGVIAMTLRRAKSTISRELRRNALPNGRYSPLHAAGA
jgi:hypothetical protein